MKTRPTAPPPRKVLVILDLAGGVSARDILSGIFRFVA